MAECLLQPENKIHEGQKAIDPDLLFVSFGKNTLENQAPLPKEAEENPPDQEKEKDGVVPQIKSEKEKRTFDHIIDKFERLYVKALDKEQSVSKKLHQKIQSLTENNREAMKYLEEKKKEIDQLFETIKSSEEKVSLSILEEYKKKMMDFLALDSKNYKDQNYKIQDVLIFLLLNNDLQAYFEKELKLPNLFLKKEVENKKDGKQEGDPLKGLKEGLINSFGFQLGFTPLVMKYKLIKSFLSSLLLPLSEFAKTNGKPWPKISNLTLKQIETLLKEMEAQKKSHPPHQDNSKSPLGVFDEIKRLKNSMILPNFTLQDKTKTNSQLPVGQMYLETYRPRQGEHEFFSNGGLTNLEQGISLETVHTSIRKVIQVGDIILLDTLYEILTKEWSFPCDYVTLKDVFSDKVIEMSFHSRWHQTQILVLTEKYEILQERLDKGYFILADSQRRMRLFPTKNISEVLKKTIQEKMKGKGKVEVQVLRIKNVEFMLSCREKFIPFSFAGPAVGLFG